MADGQDNSYKKGRGSQIRLKNRYHHLHTEFDEEFLHSEEFAEQLKRTQITEVFPKTIINEVTSPDLGFYYSLNPYQGCEHGCLYCYARPTHEYWGYDPGQDFESKILVKKNATALLEAAFLKPKYEPHTIMMSGNTDCYQPVESKLEITRSLLEIFLKYKHPVGIITKNALVLRDLDILTKLASLKLVSVALSITTLNEETRRLMEPRTVSVQRRLDTLSKLTEAGIPVFVMMAPIIPFVNSDEMFAVAEEVSKRGALGMGYQVVRLNGPVEPIFTDWIHKAYPNRADKVLNIIKELHGGKTSDSRFGTRMRGEGEWAVQMSRVAELARKKFFYGKKMPKLRTDLFENPDNIQLKLF
ncbi:MAG: PA0069 family radical SAM protein [Flavobacteriales bacterium]